MQLNQLKTNYQIKEIPFNVYPRPSLKRENFTNLNGIWDFEVVKKGKTVYGGNILVPFAPESALSNVKRITKKGEILVYKRTINVQNTSNLTILHFGAVDCICSVYVNGNFVCKNENGYLPFSADITKFITVGENQLKVEVVDSLNKNYPYGKQTNKRGGMWYTPISGIWQTVWLENVPKNYIKKLKITPTLNSVKIEVFGGEKIKTLTLEGVDYEFEDALTISIKNPKLWTPETPNLYNFTIVSGEDKIESYFALREVGFNEKGLTLNGKNYFFNGVLDQGYFPDGIYLPPNEQGFIDDIKNMKELGFNMLRKHIKIEPEIFYYYCDKIGMAVFQDFVNNGKYSFVADTALPTIGFKKFKLGLPTKKQKEIFLEVSSKTVKQLYNFPCVVYYTIFNEGWGQHNATEIYKVFKKLDSTRVYDTASGWFNNCESDVKSEHVYFKKINIKSDGKKPLVLSEFGGYTYKINEHSFNLYKTYGYKKCTNDTFMLDLESLYIDQVIPCILKEKLCALVLTQLSDVEDETNGLYTYDRKVLKVDKEKMLEISNKIYNAYNSAINKKN
ncbi:MAG: glycoside hydrolase family 2 [Clostridia bacterium]|nr:glycoside hydrolase family 2 [Clostridia bacterium]